jgi:hypothetical protein
MASFFEVRKKDIMNSTIFAFRKNTHKIKIHLLKRWIFVDYI